MCTHQRRSCFTSTCDVSCGSASCEQDKAVCCSSTQAPTKAPSNAPSNIATNAPSNTPTTDATQCQTLSQCSPNKNLGTFVDPNACAAAVSSDSDCRPQFMWHSQNSVNLGSWGCRCCRADSALSIGSHGTWNIYAVTGNDCLRLSSNKCTDKSSYRQLGLHFHNL